MLAALLTAVLQWLGELLRRQLGCAGQDGVAKPGLRARLDGRLAEWKAGRDVK